MKIFKEKDFTPRQFKYLRKLGNGMPIRDKHVLNKLKCLGVVELLVETGKRSPYPDGLVYWHVKSMEPFYVEYVGGFFREPSVDDVRYVTVRKSNPDFTGLLKATMRGRYATSPHYTAKDGKLYLREYNGTETLVVEYTAWADRITYKYRNAAGEWVTLEPRFIKDVKNKTKDVIPVACFNVTRSCASYDYQLMHNYFGEVGQTYEDLSQDRSDSHHTWMIPFVKFFNIKQFESHDDFRAFLKRTLIPNKDGQK